MNRPPIIVILGHVDHGKTTLLDYLRHSNIAAREAGGITQHIRSFQLTTPDKSLMTFIDTPGHAAFSQLRSRGSQLADIAILIVSAVDGVMPQTLESIAFIQKAGIPFLVAINKTDVSGADPDRIKTQLTEANVVVEDFGGDVPSVNISAKTGAGVPELLELLSLSVSLNPPQADPAADLEALVLEGRLDHRRGPLATVIVKNGTLSVGQVLYTDINLGKVKALTDSSGQPVSQALPSQPVEILGLNQVIPAGELLSQNPHSLNTAALSSKINPTQTGQLNIILKTDVFGSLEAILGQLDPGINIIHSGTGDITENDVSLAKTASAQIVGFNVKMSASVAKLAQVEKVTVHFFKIIYELLESWEKILHPPITETILGKAEIAAQFKIGPDRVAGCKVLEGHLEKAAKLRLVREDKVVGETKFKSMKSGKTEVSSIKSPAEFGAVFSPYLDFKIGDHIIAFQTHGST